MSYYRPIKKEELIKWFWEEYKIVDGRADVDIDTLAQTLIDSFDILIHSLTAT